MRAPPVHPLYTPRTDKPAHETAPVLSFLCVGARRVTRPVTRPVIGDLTGPAGALPFAQGQALYGRPICVNFY